MINRSCISKLLTAMFLSSISVFLVNANAATAQSVRVQNGLGEWGFGWMFSHAGNCYVALPEHVAGPLPRITVTTAAPVVSDQATVQRPFWEGIDLAVAAVDRGALNSRCIASLNDLDATPRTRSASEAILLRISPLGEEERLPLRVLDRGYLSFTGEVTDQSDRIAQGTSGAFAFVLDRPIGMAITSDDPSRARFMRAEEIVLNLERYLSNQGGIFSSPVEERPVAPSSQWIPILEVSANVPPTLPQFGSNNLTGDGFYILEPTGPVELTLRLDTIDPTAVSRLRLTAPAGDYAVPRDVAIYLDAGEDGNRFRFWTQGQMTPDGVFDTGPLSPRNARFIRVIMRSAWGEGAIALDRVVIE